jgi:hypothetical protein
MNISHYAKAITYIALAVVGVLVTALTDNVVTTAELVNVAIIGVGAVATYFVPNLPEGPGGYLKAVVAFVAAALVALQSFLTDGITTAEWLQIAVAAFAGIGVYIVPNEPPREFVPGQTLRADLR